MSAGYVASARIDRGRPRLIAAPVAAARPLEAWPPFAATSATGAADSDDRILDTGSAAPPAVEVRWAAFRERWSQLWFFVLDAESWR